MSDWVLKNQISSIKRTKKAKISLDKSQVIGYNKENKTKEVNTMNKEIIKAMNKKATKKDAIRKWWNKNGYKVMRVILFPIWIGIVLKDKIEGYLNSKCRWSDERANEILSYYIPRKAKWDAEDKSFYFADNGMGWGMRENRKYLKFRDRRWWDCNRGFWGGDIRAYLLEKFEMEGFEKIVGDTYDQWAEITFKLIEK